MMEGKFCSHGEGNFPIGSAGMRSIAKEHGTWKINEMGRGG
jgi:hypothetical protein